MSKHNILVIPSGTGTAVEIWKSLQNHRVFTLFGADTDPENIGTNLFVKTEICPLLTDPWFWSWLESYIKRHNIDLVMPTHDAFILPFAKKQRVGKAKLMSPNPFASEIIKSKARTYRALYRDIATPTIYYKKPPFPAFIKPAEGRGSLGAHKITNKKEWIFYNNILENPLCTEYLPGKEYTVDCLCDLNGRLLSATPRLRHKIKDGMTTTGYTVANKALQKMAKAISKRLHLPGLWFFQAKENVFAQPVLLEINARVAGTMCLTRAAGVNLPDLAARLFIGETLTSIPKAIIGMKVSRHLTEIITKPHTMQKIEMVSWDLDDTILNSHWTSEGQVKVNSKAAKLIIQLHNAGITQYIISKNRELTGKPPLEIWNILTNLGLPMVFKDILINNKNKSEILIGLMCGLKEYQVIHVDDAFSERTEINRELPFLYTADINTCYNLLSSLCRS